jgi:hypothetical protein
MALDGGPEFTFLTPVYEDTIEERLDTTLYVAHLL